MEKRVFLAILLSFAVLAIYQTFFAPPPPPEAAKTAAAATGVAALPPAGAAAPGAAAIPAPSQPPTAPGAAPLVAAEAARDIVVDTDTVRAVISTEGATLRSWKLKHYLESNQPLELVPENLPRDYPKPFTLATNDLALSNTLAVALFQPSADALALGSTPGALSFVYRDQSGLSARKTFYFQPEGHPYVLKVEAAVEVSGVSRPIKLLWGPALGLGYSPDGSRTVAARAVQSRDNKVEQLTASTLQKTPHYEGDLKFAGVDDQYFLSAALPGSEKITVDYQPLTLPIPNDPKNATRTFVAYSVNAPGAVSLPYFLGPKDFDILHSLDPQLVRVIDFGFFSPIVVPLLQALKWINRYIGNYGWSIIALTFLLNVAMFPLRHRSMVSMRKMQAIQPEIKAIQDRYAKYKVTDPEKQKMNQEMMALYKQKGINPASGCAPMLLTLPVLWAFYALLSAAIELRGAPFMFWIHDLSRHDPFYITPVLMGATMLIQQRMMPAAGDPMQRNMLLLMPVVFTATSFFWPSGLVIYWFASNLLAIGQQQLTNVIIGGPPTAPRSTVNAKLKKS